MTAKDFLVTLKQTVRYTFVANKIAHFEVFDTKKYRIERVNNTIPDIVLCKELLHIHDGIVDVLIVLAWCGHGDGDDSNLLLLLFVFQKKDSYLTK